MNKVTPCVRIADVRSISKIRQSFSQVVQVYQIAHSASVSTPLRQLVGFRRLHIEPQNVASLSIDCPVSSRAVWKNGRSCCSTNKNQWPVWVLVTKVWNYHFCSWHTIIENGRHCDMPLKIEAYSYNVFYTYICSISWKALPRISIRFDFTGRVYELFLISGHMQLDESQQRAHPPPI